MADHEEHAPPAGRYNAGQKVLFWLLTLCMLGLFVTGFCFWRPLRGRAADHAHPPGEPAARGLLRSASSCCHRPHLHVVLDEGIDPRDDAGLGHAQLGPLQPPGVARRGHEKKLRLRSSMQREQLTPDEIATRTVPRGSLPAAAGAADVFADRAARLRALAGGARDGRLPRVHRARRRRAAKAARVDAADPPAVADEIARCNEHGIPPLNFQTHVRDPQWRNGLRHLLRGLADRTTGTPAAVVDAPRRLAATSSTRPRRASCWRALHSGLDIAAAPLIAAGPAGLFHALVDHARGRVVSADRRGDDLPVLRLEAHRERGANRRRRRATVSCIARCATRSGTWCVSSAATAKARRASATT